MKPGIQNHYQAAKGKPLKSITVMFGYTSIDCGPIAQQAIAIGANSRLVALLATSLVTLAPWLRLQERNALPLHRPTQVYVR